MRIAVINGPNLNLLGKREPEVYGHISFEQYFETLRAQFAHIAITYAQSNIEGDIINYIQDAGANSDGILLNAAGYTHTSVAIADAVAAITIPVIEVHLSHPLSREDYRHISIVGTKCKAAVSGFGLYGYNLALQGLLSLMP